MEESRKVGRPTSKTDARDRLMFHARELFMVMAYDKVSIRLIAQKAGVNSSLIRYYFGNKEGLFETMLRETLAPMFERMNALIESSDTESFLDLMRTYYREMNKLPQFPRLIAQVMYMPPSQTQRRLMEKVFKDVQTPMQGALTEKLTNSGILRPDMDPKLCRLSYISLVVFPFIAPPAMLYMHGIELNEEFLSKLLEHNIKLMSHGFLAAEQG